MSFFSEMLKNAYRVIFVLPPGVTLIWVRGKILGWSGAAPLWTRPLKHPIDDLYGIETSGNLGYTQLNSGKPSDVYTTSYGGSQPSIVRKILTLVPNLEQSTFLDLGCGKGRILAVATEFPFRHIVGVELAPSLAPIARSNAAIMRERFPERTPITVIEGDAVETPLPEGPLVVYFYQPFYRALMKKVLANLERAILTNPSRPVYVISYNPVDASLYDGSPVFRRYYAANLPFAPEEFGCGAAFEDRDDCVAVWQSCGPHIVPIPSGADVKIRVIPPGRRAEVVPAEESSLPR